jgi:polysaccharide biosynthesis protein PelA
MDMLLMKLVTISVGILIVLVLLFAFWWSKRDKPYRWIIYYGSGLTTNNLKTVDLAILEPSNIAASDYPSLTNTKFVGYMSVGEASESRLYWKDIHDKDFIIEKNPDWEGAWRVDVRSEEWQKILLEKVIPEILAEGYDGVYLDTVDTALYLEQKDPSKFRGSKRALVEFVQTIRKNFPKIMIIANNGLEYLEYYGSEIDGITVEDLYTRYQFTDKTYIKTPIETTEYKEKILDAFREKHNKPIYNILYDTSDTSELARYAIVRSEERAYAWYLTTADLMHLGTIN